MKKNEHDKVIIEIDDDELLDFDEEAQKEKSLRVLAFSLGGENYCINITQAKEVIRIGQVTKVPNTPAFILGTMNLRGEIISLVDIKYFFGFEQIDKNDDARVIITDIDGQKIGLVIDRIKETVDILQSSIQPPLATLRGELAQYTIGQVQLGKDILILLDLKKVIHCDEIELLRKGEAR